MYQKISNQFQGSLIVKKLHLKLYMFYFKLGRNSIKYSISYTTLPKSVLSRGSKNVINRKLKGKTVA